MDRVADGISIGSLEDCLDHGRLTEAGIEAVLQLYGHPRERALIPLPIPVLQLEVRDRVALDPARLREGVAFIREQRSVGRQVLVACGAGISRSPAFVAAYLHEEGMGLAEAFARIASARPIHPHRALVQSLAEYYNLDLQIHGVAERAGR